MKIFLDANILVSVLNKEYPVFTYSSRLLSLVDTPGYSVYTSPLCLAIAFYFSEKKSGSLVARKKSDLLAQKLSFTNMGQQEIDKVVRNKAIRDFEDGLQYYSALGTGCNVIVTEDLNDFYFSEIPVLTSRGFLENYIF